MSKLKLYADDTVIYNASQNIKAAEIELQQDLLNYQTWCEQNKLSVNSSKTKIMIFSTSDRKLKTLDVSIHLENRLQVVPTYKYLGVILDPLLSYKKHILEQCKTIGFRSYQLSCMRAFLTKKLSLKVYVSTVLPYFDYADILFKNANVTLLAKLQYAQNRCLKTCLLLPHLTDTDYVHAKANLPLLAERRKAHMLNYMYKRSTQDAYVDNRLLHTRAHEGPLLRILRSNSAQYDRSVEYHGAGCWNSLLPGRRLAETYKIFQIETKKVLRASVPLVLD